MCQLVESSWSYHNRHSNVEPQHISGHIDVTHIYQYPRPKPAHIAEAAVIDGSESCVEPRIPWQWPVHSSVIWVDIEASKVWFVFRIQGLIDSKKLWLSSCKRMLSYDYRNWTFEAECEQYISRIFSMHRRKDSVPKKVSTGTIDKC